MTPLVDEELARRISAGQTRWLVTGVAGFIGSNLLEPLLALGQEVVGLYNLLTGHPRNCNEVRPKLGEQAWQRHCPDWQESKQVRQRGGRPPVTHCGHQDPVRHSRYVAATRDRACQEAGMDGCPH